MSPSKMRCPECGDEMNHHADKRVDPTDEHEAALADADLGGFVLETHGCPGCGAVESRPAGRVP
ncbi:MAG: hypothetical protein QOD06_1856 [Candidatus Binatota bacterium]|jgi:ribosomal protein S27AE|nr:hypothetical protein [Candidatus Binatota bacterium]